MTRPSCLWSKGSGYLIEFPYLRSGVILIQKSLSCRYPQCFDGPTARRTFEDSPGSTPLRKRSTQALWGYRAGRFVFDGGAGCGWTRRNAVCERRLRNVGTLGAMLREITAAQ